MWRVKQLADPDGILAPGIVLNREPGVHLRNLKSMPEIEESVTKCIECGFCEPVCPSRNVTTTPRQRIALRREIARQAAGSPVQRALLAQYEYDGVETCAVDGSCKYACPVAIDTGTLIKDLRHAEHGEGAERGRSGPGARRFASGRSRAARTGLRVGGSAARPHGARASRRHRAPRSCRSPYARARLRSTCRRASTGSSATITTACRSTRRCPRRSWRCRRAAGLPLWIPDDVPGHCCGTPWSSKGYARRATS